MASSFAKLSLILGSCCYASIFCSASAKSVCIEDALADALSASFDLRISAADTNIKRAELSSKSAELLPQVRATYSSEFLRGLDGNNNQAAAPVVVGNTILPGNTARTQNVISLNFNHSLYDSGAKRMECRAARLNVEATRTQQQVALRDLKLRLVDAYVEALLVSIHMNEREEELLLQRQAYEVQQRLFKAGKISRVVLGERAISVQSADDALQQAKQEYGERLARLGQITRKSYSADETDLVGFESLPSQVPGEAPDMAASAEIRAAQLAIRSAEAELSAIKRQRFLQVGCYGGLVFYGASETNWFKSSAALGPRQVNVGVNASLPIFDGFKTRAECKKKEFEIARLKLQRDKREWELKSEYERLSGAANDYKVEMHTKARLLREGAEQVSMIKRLADSRFEEPQAYFDEQIAQLQKRLGEERTKVLRAAALMKMQIMSES
jgi:outer membrane protein TolC